MSLPFSPIRDFGLAVILSNGVSHESQVIQEHRIQANRQFRSAVSTSPRSLEDKFRELANQWRGGSGHQSSVRALASHPAYQRIIGMGDPVVPLLLRELEEKPDHWFWALWAITGIDPVRPEHQGRLRQMAQDWIRWGRANGYSW